MASPHWNSPWKGGFETRGPLAPFLFLLVAEGLSGLVKKSIDCGLFDEFQLGSELAFPVLQYADDTIIMCKNTRENLWCLKALLRVFEMASGLRVNFHKSYFNVDEEELSIAAQFLYCKIGEVPFKLLGISVGANPRLSTTWKPIVKKLRSRLTTWRSRHLL